MIPLKDENPTEITPFVTVALIVANVGVWLAIQGAGAGAEFADSLCRFGAIPGKITGRLPVDVPVMLGNHVCPIETNGLVPLVTSMFLHGGWMHLIGNMWFLWVFGNNIEDSMGHLRFLVFYLGTGLAACAVHIVANLGSGVPVVGASGAISGIMGAYLLLYPKVRVHTLVVLLFFVRMVAIPAAFWLGLWFVLQLLQAAGGEGGGVAFGAHIGGFVAGLVTVRLFARRKLVAAKRRGHVLGREELPEWERWWGLRKALRRRSARPRAARRRSSESAALPAARARSGFPAGPPPSAIGKPRRDREPPGCGRG